MATAEVVIDGLRWPHAPLWHADEGELVVATVADACIWRVDVARLTRSLWAEPRGGPNGAVLADDGGLLVTNNGGFDFATLGLWPDPPPYRPVPPGLQRVRPNGRVDDIAGQGEMTGPAGVSAAADGTVLVADPPRWPPPEDPPAGRVWALDPDKTLAVWRDGFWNPTAVAHLPGGGVAVTDRAGVVRIDPDGARSWEVTGVGPSTGLAVDEDGRLYVATGNLVRVVEAGRERDALEVPVEDADLTSCCIGGRSGRDVFATDARTGRVWVWESAAAPAAPGHRWVVPPPSDRELEEAAAEAAAEEEAQGSSAGEPPPGASAPTGSGSGSGSATGTRSWR